MTTFHEIPEGNDVMPCPFCGEVPSHIRVSPGEKWCNVTCCCEGPEVRTMYIIPLDDEVVRDAVHQWNTRKP